MSNARFPISDRWLISVHCGDGGFDYVGHPLEALRQWVIATSHMCPGGPLPVNYGAVAALLTTKGSWRWGDDYVGLEVCYPTTVPQHLMSDLSTPAQG